jgi:hypothetical protein
MADAGRYARDYDEFHETSVDRSGSFFRRTGSMVLPHRIEL